MTLIIRQVRCIDNILQRHVLTIGAVYEQIGEEQIGEEQIGYVQISGLGRFSASRFEPVKEPSA